MGILYDQLENVLLPGMVIPEPIKLLYEGIESNKLYCDRSDGVRFGFLFSESEASSSYTDTERHGGTTIEIAASGNSGL